MPKEYCDILLFAIGTTAGLVLGFLFALFILKDVPVISRRVRSKIGKGQKRKQTGKHDKIPKQRKNKEKNIKKKKISFSERISKLTNKTSWSELSCIINKTDPVASVRKKRKKQDDSYQYIKRLKN